MKMGAVSSPHKRARALRGTLVHTPWTAPTGNVEVLIDHLIVTDDQGDIVFLGPAISADAIASLKVRRYCG
jgi:hypothetical protein